MSPTSLTKVVVVDDDATLRIATAQTLRLAGLDPIAVADGPTALGFIDRHFSGIVLTDLRMPQMDGRQLQAHLKAVDPDLPIILITGNGDVDDAVHALKLGAFDFIPKPFSADRIVSAVNRALAFRGLVLDNRRLQAAAQTIEPELPFLGESLEAAGVRAALADLARSDVHVLIEGETGVGKELAARILHGASSHRGKPFVVVQCAAIADAGMEEALYGSSSLSQLRAKPGLVEAAQGGALLLHDLDRASPMLQAELTRLMEERGFVAPKNGEFRPVSLRVIGASGQRLSTCVDLGQFRSDLYYSFAAAKISIPPLRERREDVFALFAAFQAEAARRLGRPAPSLSSTTQQTLLTHHWPGNARELQHFAERVVLGIATPNSESAAPSMDSLPDRVNAFEASLIQQALRETQGDVRGALDRLKIPRKTFYDKLARHGIDIGAFRLKPLS